MAPGCCCCGLRIILSLLPRWATRGRYCCRAGGAAFFSGLSSVSPSSILMKSSTCIEGGRLVFCLLAERNPSRREPSLALLKGFCDTGRLPPRPAPRNSAYFRLPLHRISNHTSYDYVLSSATCFLRNFHCVFCLQSRWAVLLSEFLEIQVAIIGATKHLGWCCDFQNILGRISSQLNDVFGCHQCCCR